MLTPEDSLLVIVDMQEKFVPAIPGFKRAASKIALLTGAAAELGMPVLVTEQYPKGLGPTVPEINGILPDGTQKIEKAAFSCFGQPEFAEAVKNSGRKNLIFTGIEAHICVLQTILEAKELGYTPWVADDAIASRRDSDAETALLNLRGKGVEILSAEALVFMLLKTSKSPHFKNIQKLVIACV